MELRKISIIALLAVAVGVMAVPARRDGFVRTAADGTEKMVWLHGNEDFHYMTDAEGNWLEEETLLPLSAEVKGDRLKAKGERAIRRAPQQKMVGGELNVAPRGLIILVNFQNQAFVTPYDTMNNMMNGTNFTRHYAYSYDHNGRHYEGTVNANGSARQYFIDQSFGQYQPVFDVVGPYTVSSNYEVYGRNSGGSDSNVGQMIKEACELADQNGADFTLYDNNNDGKVDFVYVIYAGEGEADGGDANTIWPHNWTLNSWGKYCTVDGKQVNNYACSNEKDHFTGVYAGIGTFVHEFGHVIGLPDLYATQSSLTHKTCGMWDIMDYGCYNNESNTPPGYSAYERFFCGWLTPRVLRQAENTTLQPIDNQEALLMCSGDRHNLNGFDPNPSTFYMLEARALTNWDAYLPGDGLMITKVSYNSYDWTYNQVNNSPNSQGIDILEADGLKPSYVAGSSNGYLGKPGDLFPTGATEWTAFANHEVTEITKDANGTIHFKYRGGSTTELTEQAVENVSAQKILKDGRVYILRGGKTYDILGHENHQL